MISISRRFLRSAALLTLILPSVAFLLTWVRPVLALPAACALLAAFALTLRRPSAARPSVARPIAANLFGDEDDSFSLSLWALLALVACAVLWTLLSGIGGMFYQNEDHYGRNAILHDLLEHPWPVRFPGTPYALTYYIAYWLLPALVGKGAAFLLGEGVRWTAANAALFVQTVWFLVLIFLFLLWLVRARTLLPACLSLLIFVMFSGMDALMAGYINDWNNQIEWWAGTYQFSSNTTCLFWVYNQAVPAWLAVMLLLSAPGDLGVFALVGLASFPFAPFPFIGLFVCMAALAVCALRREIRAGGLPGGARAFLRRCLTAPNLLACAAILPIFVPYFASNQASSEAPFRFEPLLHAFSPRTALFRLLLFELIEFGALAFVLGARFRREPLFLASVVLLILSPLFRIGFKADLGMRASIPGLTLLCVCAIRFLLDARKRRQDRYAAGVLALLLLIGSVTPLLEFERGAYKVKLAGTPFMYSDPYKTVLCEDADTFNFICKDTGASFFYRHIARR